MFVSAADAENLTSPERRRRCFVPFGAIRRLFFGGFAESSCRSLFSGLGTKTLVFCNEEGACCPSLAGENAQGEMVDKRQDLSIWRCRPGGPNFLVDQPL